MQSSKLANILVSKRDKFTLNKCTKNDFEEEEMHEIHVSAV